MPSLIACSTNPTATVLRYFILGVKLSLIAYNNATLAIVLYLSYSKCLTRFLTFFSGLMDGCRLHIFPRKNEINLRQV